MCGLPGRACSEPEGEVLDWLRSATARFFFVQRVAAGALDPLDSVGCAGVPGETDLSCSLTRLRHFSAYVRTDLEHPERSGPL